MGRFSPKSLDLDGKVILVTGGTGFLGEHLVRALRADGRVAVWGFPGMVTRMLQLPVSNNEVMPAHVAVSGGGEPLKGMTAISAGWAFSVRVSWSSGPSRISSESFCSRASSTS